MLEEYEAQIAELEAKYQNAPPGQIAFYGSSTMRLWPGLNRDFPGLGIQNFGFGGSTLEQCAGYFERLFAPRRPRAMVFYGGDNDLALGASPQNVWDSLRALLDIRDATLGAIPFAFVSIKPSPSRMELLPQIIEANEWCWREIQARQGAVWVDVFAPMLGEDGAPRRELYLGDGLHLSRAGYDLWRRVLVREVDCLSAGS